MVKKLIMFSFLFCWCLNVYGQESITDTIEILSDVTTYTDNNVFWPYLDPIWVDFVELYKRYETQCFNDSTKQCFNYYINFHRFNYYINLFGSSTLDSLVVGENYKIPCTKHDFDLGIDMNYRGTHEEWVHVQPSFIGFMQYLKEKR